MPPNEPQPASDPLGELLAGSTAAAWVSAPADDPAETIRAAMRRLRDQPPFEPTRVDPISPAAYAAALDILGLPPDHRLTLAELSHAAAAVLQRAADDPPRTSAGGFGAAPHTSGATLHHPPDRLTTYLHTHGFTRTDP